MPGEIVPDKPFVVVIAATKDSLHAECFTDVVGEADTYKAALDMMTMEVLKIKRERPSARNFHYHQGGAQVSWTQGLWHYAAYIVRRFE